MISRQRFRGSRLGSVYCFYYYRHFLTACVLSVIMAALLSGTSGFAARLGRERVARLGQSAPGDQRRYFRAPPFSLFCGDDTASAGWQTGLERRTRGF
jgi:hypothetical protein